MEGVAAFNPTDLVLLHKDHVARLLEDLGYSYGDSGPWFGDPARSAPFFLLYFEMHGELIVRDAATYLFDYQEEVWEYVAQSRA